MLLCSVCVHCKHAAEFLVTMQNMSTEVIGGEIEGSGIRTKDNWVLRLWELMEYRWTL